jgi:hypothetical protein
LGNSYSRNNSSSIGGGGKISLMSMDHRNSSDTDLSRPISPTIHASFVPIPSNGHNGGMHTIGKPDTGGGVPLKSLPIEIPYKKYTRGSLRKLDTGGGVPLKSLPVEIPYKEYNRGSVGKPTTRGNAPLKSPPTQHRQNNISAMAAGGYTDDGYMTSESDNPQGGSGIELQRQAEVKNALLAHRQVEFEIKPRRTVEADQPRSRVRGSNFLSRSQAVAGNRSALSLPSHRYDLSRTSGLPRSRHKSGRDLGGNRASSDNALVNFDTVLSPWTDAADWLVANTDSVITILRGLVGPGTSLLSHLKSIMNHDIQGFKKIMHRYISSDPRFLTISA